MRDTSSAGRRTLRHARLRARVSGTAERPRLSVYRSLRHVHVQLIDDAAGKTLASASSQLGEVKTAVTHGGNRTAAGKVGELIAKRAATLGIKKVCFDRGGFMYHGVIAAVAEAARKAGLEF